MANPKYKYSLTAYATRVTTQYGIIKTFSAPMKTSVKITGTLQAQSTGGSTTGHTISISTELKYKLNGGTAVSLRAGSNTAYAANTGLLTFEVTLNLSSATKLAFQLTGQATTTGSGTVKASYEAFINIEVAAIGPEEKITAALLNNMIDVVGAGTKVSAGSVIKVANYNTLATAVGASAFDTTKPLATNLSALATKINSKTFSKSWDSTSSSDW